MVSMPPLPTTRFVGSKRRLVPWIWSLIRSLEFDSFLDAFGGTGVVGYHAKIHGKQVFYNDILKFNYQIGLAIIENSSVRLSEEDVEFILQRHDGVEYPSFIQNTFRGLYYTDEENQWLDMVTKNISMIRNKYKRALAFAALAQACLVKRPFNLFHRGNLRMRLRNVHRNFRNHHAWNKSFDQLFRRFVKEYNALVFCNGRANRAYNLDVYELDVEADLVYLDPPYTPRWGRAPDYQFYYHFLEGLVNYEQWPEMIDWESPIRAIRRRPSPWLSRCRVREAFRRLFQKFQDAKYLVVSYRAEGVPSPTEIAQLLRECKAHVHVYSTTYKYVLSRRTSRELLFIAF